MDLRCQYASTHCLNTRSLKISGELHRFCLFHRRSANAAQRRWKQKKLAANGSSTSSGCSSNSSDDDAIAKPTKAATRRRQRHVTDKTEPIVTKLQHPSREIAAPQFCEPLMQGAVTVQLPPVVFPATEFGIELDALPPLFANEDLDLLDKVLEAAGPHSFTTPQDPFWETVTPFDCWWNEQTSSLAV